MSKCITSCASLSQVKRGVSRCISESSFVLIRRLGSCITVRELMTVQITRNPVQILARVMFVSWSFVVNHFSWNSPKKPLHSWQSQTIKSSYHSSWQQPHPKTSLRKNHVQRCPLWPHGRYQSKSRRSGQKQTEKKKKKNSGCEQASNSSGSQHRYSIFRDRNHVTRDKIDQRKSSLIKADFCHTLVFMRLLETQMSWSEESGGLHVLQQYYHWLEFISNYEALSGKESQTLSRSP